MSAAAKLPHDLELPECEHDGCTNRVAQPGVNFCGLRSCAAAQPKSVIGDTEQFGGGDFNGPSDRNTFNQPLPNGFDTRKRDWETGVPKS